MNENPTMREDISQETSKLQDNQFSNPPTNNKPPLLFSKRMLVVLLMFFCNANVVLIRVNINIAIVEMTSEKKIVENNVTIVRPAEFAWDSKTIGLVTSIFSYGGLLSFSCGYFTSKLGGLRICVISTMICGITTFLHPICLYRDFHWLLVCRFVTGVFDNFFLASVIEVLSRWVPKSERSTLVSFAFNGIYAGTAFVHPICGFLANRWGWPMVFYVTGIISCTLSALCFIFIKNQPSQDKWISNEERSYIISETYQAAGKSVILLFVVGTQSWFKQPYRKIFSSGPIWALNVAFLAFSWTNTMTVSCFPLFIKDISQKNTEIVGLISSVPNLIIIFSTQLTGNLMDYWKNHSTASTTRIHKTVMNISSILQILLFIGVTFVDDLTTSTIVFAFIRMFASPSVLIPQLLNIIIAPASSNVIAGFNTFTMSLGTIATRTATGFMTTNHTLEEWNNCFLLTSGIAAVCALIFTAFGSSEPEPWSIPPTGLELLKTSDK